MIDTKKRDQWVSEQTFLMEVCFQMMQGKTSSSVNLELLRSVVNSAYKAGWDAAREDDKPKPLNPWVANFFERVTNLVDEGVLSKQQAAKVLGFSFPDNFPYKPKHDEE